MVKLMVLAISTFVLCFGMVVYETYKQFHKYYKKRKHRGRNHRNDSPNSDST